MSMTVLNPSHELGFVRCYLKHAKNSISILSFREYFVAYHLNPESPDAFFVGDVVGDEVICMASITVRSGELIAKSLMGFSTPYQIVGLLDACKIVAIQNARARVLHLIMPMTDCESLVDFDMLQKSGWSGVLTEITAGNRPADKTFWWNTMNRQVDSEDLAFIRLEF